jgi:DNA-directed RNA polymerase subunit RPC12/RpoP
LNSYVCSECSKNWYSATELESMKSPYCECGGKLRKEDAGNAQAAMVKVPSLEVLERHEESTKAEGTEA